MEYFLPILATHLFTTLAGALYVYLQGATPLRVIALAVWGVLFFPVAYNLVRIL